MAAEVGAAARAVEDHAAAEQEGFVDQLDQMCALLQGYSVRFMIDFSIEVFVLLARPTRPPYTPRHAAHVRRSLKRFLD